MDDVLSRLKASLEGRYEVLEEIGQGGMAVVFLAEDLKHHRKVALKVLRSELAAILGAERFLKEIEVTANLQHPNILPLFDSGEADGLLYYVMPLLEGETLREKLDRSHQLQVEEAAEIAKSVAAALDYAHRHDVIHRDIKPSNILLHDGQALVSDFGIALAMNKAGSETRLTETGLSVGTPHYMSPEQAAGDRELDARSDLYSLGAMTFEMLVGEPPYVGKTAQAVVAKILTDTPQPIRRTRELVPTNVEAAVAKALARSPADRFASAADFANALANPAFTLPHLDGVSGVGTGARPGIWRPLGLVAFGVSAVAVALAAWGWLRPSPPKVVARYNLASLPGQEFLDREQISFDVGREGEVIVYSGPGDGGNQLWAKYRNQVSAVPIPGTAGAIGPTLSPDGTEVAFRTEGELRKVPLQGGPAITLADSVVSHPAAWLEDGTLVYVGSSRPFRLYRVSAAGGESEELWVTMPDSLNAYHPSPLPGSRGILVTLCDVGCRDVAEIWGLDFKTGEAHRFISDAVRAWYLESGHIVFVRSDGAVFGASFDAKALELTGDAVPLLNGVMVGSAFPEMALSSDGTLLIREGVGGASVPNREVVYVSRAGVARPVDPAWRVSIQWNAGFALNPAGTHLAIGLRTAEGDDVFIKELDDGPLSRLTFDPVQEARPRWSPDGELVYFTRYAQGSSDLYVGRADGAEPVRPVLVREARIFQHDWTPDGAWLVARVGGTIGMSGSRNIVAYQMAGDTVEVPILDSAYDMVSPRLSRNGRWLAYASQESGDWEVYVRPFPDVSSGKWPISRGGGYMPLWANSGKELFYASADRTLMVVEVETEGNFGASDPRPLFQIPDEVNIGFLRNAYDVTPDDQEFIMVRYLAFEDTAEPPVILVQNWLEEVKERMREEGG